MARRAKRKATKRKAATKKKTATRRARARDDMKIVAVAGAAIPREGGVGRFHYDRAVGRTVGEYLASFADADERRYAAKWLSQFVHREGRLRFR